MFMHAVYDMKPTYSHKILIPFRLKKYYTWETVGQARPLTGSSLRLPIELLVSKLCGSSQSVLITNSIAVVLSYYRIRNITHITTTKVKPTKPPTWGAHLFHQTTELITTFKSVTHDQATSQPQDITAFERYYTAWWQRHTCVYNIPNGWDANTPNLKYYVHPLGRY